MKNTIIKSTALLTAIFALTIILAPMAADASYSYGDRYGYNHPTYVYDYYPQPVAQPIYYPVVQPTPIYYQQPVYYPTYPALTASCYANATSVYTGNSVTWSVNASGGTGSYSYSWSGTDGLYGSGSIIYKNYYNTGLKTASVIVYSGNQTVNVSCGNSVNVYNNNYYSTNYPIYYQQPVVVQTTPTYVVSSPLNNTVASNNLDIGCYADPTSVTANQPITWTAEVTGGTAPYTYSWTGSDGLTGSQSSATKYYSTTGNKSAIVSITSADGKTGTRACSNAVAVRSTTSYVARTTTPSAAPASVQTTNNQPANAAYSAAALFSLSNVPWGWVAVLVILILFATVLYLLFNRKKI